MKIAISIGHVLAHREEMEKKANSIKRRDVRRGAARRDRSR